MGASISIKTLNGLALRGVRPNGEPGEAFVGGSVQGDKMTLTFRKTTVTKTSARRWTRTETIRMVMCERDWINLDDYVWRAVRSNVFVTETTEAPRNYHAWKVPSLTVNGVGGCTELRKAN